MNSYKNVLLINFGGIGDEILFMPVLKGLKKEFPDAKLTLCLEGRSSAFLKLTDLLDSYFFVDIKTKNKYLEMFKLYFKALTGKYDLVISSGSNPLISILLFLTGIKTRVGYSSSIISKNFLTYPVKLNKNQYASEMYYDLIKPIVNAEYELPHINMAEHAKMPHSVLIHPGVSAISVSKNIVKTITAKKWAEIIRRLLKCGKKVHLAGGPDDVDCITEIREELRSEDLTNFTDMYGKTKNIFDLAELIKKSEVLVCSDSAPMHIGVATNTKTVAIFGPTDDTKLLPKSDNFVAIKNNVNCRPCLWENRQTTCQNLYCLDISIDEIINKICL